MVGEWQKGPGLSLFNALRRELGDVPILAEDLGVITADVVQLRDMVDAPVPRHPFRQRSSHLRLQLQALDRATDRNRGRDPQVHG